MAKRLYTVQPGESLSVIARDRLGDMERWKEIAYINSLEYPYLIRPGQLLLLPDNGEPLEIVITKGAPQKPAPAGTTTANQAGIQLTPATILVGVAVVAAVLFWDSR